MYTNDMLRKINVVVPQCSLQTLRQINVRINQPGVKCLYVTNFRKIDETIKF